jgi:hypothetical protein
MNASVLLFVIPAKAGIHLPPLKFHRSVMGPRLRGGDEVFECERL